MPQRWTSFTLLSLIIKLYHNKYIYRLSQLKLFITYLILGCQCSLGLWSFKWLILFFKMIVKCENMCQGIAGLNQKIIIYCVTTPTKIYVLKKGAWLSHWLKYFSALMLITTREHYHPHWNKRDMWWYEIYNLCSFNTVESGSISAMLPHTYISSLICENKSVIIYYYPQGMFCLLSSWEHFCWGIGKLLKWWTKYIEKQRDSIEKC